MGYGSSKSFYNGETLFMNNKTCHSLIKLEKFNKGSSDPRKFKL